MIIGYKFYLKFLQNIILDKTTRLNDPKDNL